MTILCASCYEPAYVTDSGKYRLTPNTVTSVPLALQTVPLHHSCRLAFQSEHGVLAECSEPLPAPRAEIDTRRGA
jgi:hypothetical protein